MKFFPIRAVSLLTLFIIGLSGFASLKGILSDDGRGSYAYESIRGHIITIYGKGIYQHMSAEVAIQGIAQDYVTFFVGIPLLLVSLILTRRESVKGQLLLAGTLGYFFVTYLFYLVMAMYNTLFLVYSFLMGASFFAFYLTMSSFRVQKLSDSFSRNAPTKSAGGFLIFNSICIAFLWLSIVVPPLLDGSMYPKEVEHYTTLIVQGLDLGLLLPLATVSGVLLIKKKPMGYLIAPVYLVFLSLLMTALCAKIIAMGLEGYNIIPVIFIIPTITLISIVFSHLMLKGIKVY